MSGPDWSRKVFRLRKIPSRISTLHNAASLLGETLAIPLDHIRVCSLAKSLNRWESPRTKVATVQFRVLPASLGDVNRQEWEIDLPSQDDEKVILGTHFRGLTVLNDAEPSKNQCDCIAISGLASHPFGSWQPHGPDKSFMWIRDELPKALPGVRAITYGYESPLSESNSFQSISDIALGLIHQLNSGGWSLSSATPIVFLAHSLGGLVLKEALVQVANQESGLSGILTNTRGAIMFGVPSLGMEQSHLAAMVKGQANDALIQDLSRGNGSNYLRQLNKSFDGILLTSHTPIYWMYETKESKTVLQRTDGSWDRNGPATILVNPDSATGHRNRSAKHASFTIPINEDHTNMVKFSNGDSSLNVVVSLLNGLCDPLLKQMPQPSTQGLTRGRQETDNGLAGASSVATSPGRIESPNPEDEKHLQDVGRILTSLEEIHHKFYTPELDYRIGQVGEPLENTFRWVFDLQFFCKWLQEDSGLFWIHGKPGSGKSTLMKYLYKSEQTWQLLHRWQRTSLELRAGFFFHYRGTALQKSFEGILRSLVVQILAPFHESFMKQHQEIWNTYSGMRSRVRSLQKELKRMENAVRDVEAGLAEATSCMERASMTTDDYAAHVGFLKAHRHELKALGFRQARAQAELVMVAGTLREKVPSLAAIVRPYMASPEAKFLREVIDDFRSKENNLIPSLECILRRLLGQNIRHMDLLLFFDALDEYDGHLDLISKFIKGLIETPSTSSTCVKVCLSSRPWRELHAHFACYPNFGVQDYTKADIEMYAARSLAPLYKANPSVTTVIPAILARANGVFLWVKLAVAELLQIGDVDVSKDSLLQKLQQLPGDLYNFYNLIVERVPVQKRRCMFALLELLVKQHMPTTAENIREAVLMSDCATFQEAQRELKKARKSIREGIQVDADKINHDIAAWGGGLVEIKDDCPQLMHQTVFEFVTSLEFKRIVLLDHFKHCVLKAIDSCPESLAENEYFDDPIIAYHGQESESTTGNSQLGFVMSIPRDKLGKLRGLGTVCDPRVAFMVLNGLLLCINDWAAARPGEFKAEGSMTFPLLSKFVFSSQRPVFHEKHLATARILLENGYRVQWDSDFFITLIRRTWRMKEKLYCEVPLPALCGLALLALDHGQDPNVRIDMTLNTGMLSCSALHMAPPCVSAALIDKGAEVNARDSQGRTPLEWVLEFPEETAGLYNPDWDTELRFNKCRLLVDAGAETFYRRLARAWADALDSFDEAGYDTQGIRRSLNAKASRWQAPWLRLLNF